MAFPEIKERCHATGHLLAQLTPPTPEMAAILNHLRKQVEIATDWAELGDEEQATLMIITLQPSIDTTTLECLDPKIHVEVDAIIESVRSRTPTLRYPFTKDGNGTTGQ